MLVQQVATQAPSSVQTRAFRREVENERKAGGRSGQVVSDIICTAAKKESERLCATQSGTETFVNNGGLCDARSQAH